MWLKLLLFWCYMFQNTVEQTKPCPGLSSIGGAELGLVFTMEFALVWCWCVIAAWFYHSWFFQGWVICMFETGWHSEEESPKLEDSSCVIQIVVVLMLHVSEYSRPNKTLLRTFCSGRHRTWTCVHNRVCSGMMLVCHCSMVLSLMVFPGLSHLHVWSWVTLWGGIS